MNSSVKKLTEAAILSSTFIIITMIALSSGLGYGLYLDFGVPIIFALIYFRCDFKYTFLCGITSLVLVLIVLGDFVATLLISQSFLVGLLCGYLVVKSSQMLDDLYIGAILGVLFMVLIDVYCRNIIGYSFMQEFESYIDYIKSNPHMMDMLGNIDLDVIYYLCIAIFPLGMILSVYIMSIALGNKLRILNRNAKKKFFTIKNIRNYGSFINIERKYFYLGLIYIILINLIKASDIPIQGIYFKTISTCIEYISYYFIFRDAHVLIGNYINIKYKNKFINLLYFFVTIISLLNYFRVTFLISVTISILMDKKFGLRNKQKYIIDNYINTLVDENKS